ncbi:hypothetical protein ACHAXT_006970 [Thalassiosira profunda]
MQRRPRSAGRPKSAGETKTRSYFEGKAETDGDAGEAEPPTPLIHPQTEDEDGADEPVFKLLNFEEEGNAGHWETTKTVKPQPLFVDETAGGVCSVFQRRTGRAADATAQSDILCQPGNRGSQNRPGPLGALYNYIASFAGTPLGSSDETKESEEENGRSGDLSTLAAKSSNLSRLEERIRRELSLEPSTEQSEEKSANGDKVVDPDATPLEIVTSTKPDESFWMSPERDLVGPEKRGGSLHQEATLTVHVQSIQFSQHPSFTPEETEIIEVARSNSDEVDGLTAKEERMRRRKVGSERYFARLLINGSVVGDTKAGQLDWPSFAVNLGHRFHCKLSQQPTDVCLQIWKKSSAGFLPDTLISACYHSIPASPADERLQFSSSGSDPQRRWKGTLLLSSSCKVKMVKSSNAVVPQDDGSVFQKRLIRPPSSIENRSQRKAEEVSASNFSNHVLCPDRQSKLTFKLKGTAIRFNDKSLVEEPLRHRLIRARNANPASVPFPIPSSELAISEKHRDLLREAEATSVDIEGVPSNILKERFVGNASQIVEIVRGAKLRRQKHRFSEAQVIQDVARIRFANDDDVAFPEIPSKRSLFPAPTTRVPVRDPASGNCSMLLTVVSGKNVPTKLGADALVGVDSGTLATDGGLDVGATEQGTDTADEPSGLLVKIRFRGKLYQTKAVEAERVTGPRWNESFCIPLGDALQDHSVASLVDETIELALFDTTTIDLRALGGYYDDEDTKTVEHRFLGRLDVPLATVLREGSLGGFVPCQSPDLIAGYSSSIPHSASARPTSTEPERRQHLNRNAALQLYATTEPLVVLPPRSRPDYPISEGAEVVAQLNQWSSSDDHPQVLWPNHEGNSFLVCRFLRDQAPPDGFDTLSSCAHYVSQIPLSDGLDWRDKDIVLTSQQFLDILSGNRKEHAVLLANFFLHLSNHGSETSVFLAVGFAIPEGETAWVVTRCRQSGDVVFWDATTGRAYAQDDEACPLQRVDFLASPDNVYSNRERSKQPGLLDFDVSKLRKWASLNPKGRLSVQDEALRFSPPDAHAARDLEGELSEAIQNAIRSLRRTPTTFRSDVANKVARSLEKLEEAKRMGQPAKGDIIPEGIAKSRTLFGFTLHETFTSVQELIAKVEGTEIHHNRNSQVEYICAVRAFPHPGGVVSLWVFVGSLVPC